jgi:hypothetical protein
MDGTARLWERVAPAVRDFHRHQQGIAGFETIAFAAHLGDKFPTQNVKPFVLFVMKMQRCARVSGVGGDRNREGCESSFGVDRADHGLLTFGWAFGSVRVTRHSGANEYCVARVFGAWLWRDRGLCGTEGKTSNRGRAHAGGAESDKTSTIHNGFPLSLPAYLRFDPT